MTKLAEIIQSHILHHGPMDLEAFITLALNHPEHGYYSAGDPLGAGGDFITAPEVSQMFGELIGAWAADTWMQMGRPKQFSLIELGPGRGTLMADALRVTSAIPGFQESAAIHLVETNVSLRKKQRENLGDYTVRWHDSLETLPSDQPMIMVANEFLDVLPVRHFIYQEQAWHERVLGLDGEDFTWGLRPAGPDILPYTQSFERPLHGSILEVSPARLKYMRSVSNILLKASGAALFIDYGYEETQLGSTLHAIQNHKHVDLLREIGRCDITSNVDFGALKDCALENKLDVYGPAEQGAFLKNLGIEVRAQTLKQKASAQQGAEIEKALHRLTHSSEMGRLFKVLSVSYGFTGKLAGFDI